MSCESGRSVIVAGLVIVNTRCLQLPEILEISWNFIDAPGKFNCQLKYTNHLTKSGYVFKPEKLSFDHFLCSFIHNVIHS